MSWKTPKLSPATYPRPRVPKLEPKPSFVKHAHQPTGGEVSHVGRVKPSTGAQHSVQAEHAQAQIRAHRPHVIS